MPGRPKSKAKSKRSPKKRAPTRRKPTAGKAQGSGLAVEWSGLKDPKNKAVDASLRRYYKLETFANAFAKQARSKDRLITPALKVLAPLGASSMRIAFSWEDAKTIYYDAVVIHGKGKRTRCVLVAAKNAEEHSRALKRRYEALLHAAKCAPKQTATPVAAGTVYLPDRHRRTELGREVFCCIYTVPPGFEALVAGSGGKLGIQESGFKALSARDDAEARARMVRLFAQCYSATQQTGLRLPHLNDRTLLAQRGDRGGVRLLLTLPEGLRTKLSAPKFLHELVSWEAKGAGKRKLRPDTTSEFVEALTMAVGADTATAWLKRYRGSVEQKRLPAIPPLTPDELREAGF